MSNARELAELGGSYGSGGFVGMKNRIINGAMVIDQRNAGASVSFTSGVNTYALDRYYIDNATDGAFTIQQVSDAPTGFVNSLKLTVTSTDTSIGATQDAIISQRIEGLNVADLGFGTALASSITISFWVKSSLTGAFGGSLINDAYTRSYPFSFTINSANTWEQKTVTITGDTTGTWLTNNGIGMRLSFTMAAGSTYTGTANTWQGNLYFQPTGSTNVMATNGATFYITGVQLEKGSTATSFDFRSYGTELSLCERYYEVGSAEISFGAGPNGYTQFVMPYRQTKRASPTVILTNSFIAGGGSSAQAVCPYKLGGQSTITAFTASAEL